MRVLSAISLATGRIDVIHLSVNTSAPSATEEVESHQVLCSCRALCKTALSSSDGKEVWDISHIGDPWPSLPTGGPIIPKLSLWLAQRSLIGYNVLVSMIGK